MNCVYSCKIVNFRIADKYSKRTMIDRILVERRIKRFFTTLQKNNGKTNIVVKKVFYLKLNHNFF